MEIYRNIPRPPSCRAAGTWPPGSRVAGATRKIIADRFLGPVARQLGDRPPPLYKVLAAPHPIWLTKNPEKKKREGGVRGRQSGEALSDFKAGDFRQLKFSTFYK